MINFINVRNTSLHGDIMNKDTKSIAHKIVKDCMNVTEGDTIIVSSGAHNFDFAEVIAVEIAKIGAFPINVVKSDGLYRKQIEEVPETFLQHCSDVLLQMYSGARGQIDIDYFFDPLSLSGLPPEKEAALQESRKELINVILEKKMKWIGIYYPTEPKAKMYNLDFNQFSQMVWEALNVNYTEIQKRGEAIADILAHAEKVELFSQDDCCLTMSIKDRPVFVDDGVISQKDMEQSFTFANLPTGEVCCAPLESSVKGDVIFDTVFYLGEKISSLHLKIEEGTLISKSGDNIELFDKKVHSATGDWNRIAELGIGINPHLREPCGFSDLDEKVYGTVHIALGENRALSGVNQASIHWDMVVKAPTLCIDGKTILEKGTFVLPHDL